MSATQLCFGAWRETMPPGWSARQHAHHFTEMLVLLVGELEVTIAGEPFRVSPGSVVTYLPGIRHGERALGQRTTELISIAHWQHSADIPAVVRDANGRIRLLAGWMIEEHQGDADRNAAWWDAHLTALLAELGRATRPAPHPMLTGLRNWMLGHLAEPITVHDLARSVGMSRAHFIRTYRTIAGRTPMDDLRRLRVEQARELVILTSQPLHVIATRVGFNDEYHLSRTFRRYLGVSPAGYRRC